MGAQKPPLVCFAYLVGVEAAAAAVRPVCQRQRGLRQKGEAEPEEAEVVLLGIRHPDGAEEVEGEAAAAEL